MQLRDPEIPVNAETMKPKPGNTPWFGLSSYQSARRDTSEMFCGGGVGRRRRPMHADCPYPSSRSPKVRGDKKA
jgi:hypothetical protein